jgi:hypothetical protein
MSLSNVYGGTPPKGVNTILPPLGSAQVPVILKEYDNSLIGNVGVGVGVVVGVIVLVGVFVGVCVLVGVFVGVFVGVIVLVGVFVGVFVKVGVTVGVCVLVGVFVGVGVKHGFALVQTTQSPPESVIVTPIAEYVGPTPEYEITVAQPVKSNELEILYVIPSIK